MGLISLTLRGLGMWVDRGTHWEILFPAAEGRKDHTSTGQMLPRHDPMLLIPDAAAPRAVRMVDLRDKVLDLCPCTTEIAEATLQQAWSIRLGMKERSPGRIPDAFKTSDPRILGVIRLPKGILQPVGLVGPVKFNGRERLIAYAVTWTAFKSNDPTKKPTLKYRNDAPVGTGKVDLPGGDVKLFVTNLSVADSHGLSTRGTGTYEDKDFAAHYLLSEENGSEQPQEIPTLDTGSSHSQLVELGASTIPVEIFADPEHLCTNVYGEDFPP